jgi:uncharacterized membrane protein
MLHTLPAYEFRRRARAAMKPIMPLLLVVAMIAALPSLIGQTVTLLTGADPNAMLAEYYTQERMTAITSGDAAAVQAASQEIMDGVTAFFQEKAPFMVITTLITWLLSPVLTLGFNHTLIKTLRREEIAVTTVLARLPLFFKAIGLNLMIFLRLVLWMLPGMALSMFGAVVTLLEPSIGGLLMLAAMAVMFVLMIRAMYSYRLATYIMADVPETGINASIRRSKEVMKGRRMELFGLEFSFLGWRLLLSMGQSMLLGLFGGVLGMTLGMFASLFLQTYLSMAENAFYQEYAVGPISPAQQDEETEELL